MPLSEEVVVLSIPPFHCFHQNPWRRPGIEISGGVSDSHLTSPKKLIISQEAREVRIAGQIDIAD